MIAAYLRISSDTQDSRRQCDSISAWAERNGHSIGHWFKDIEGRNPRDKAAKRSDFQRLLKAVETGLVKKIIVDSQDRFGTRDAYEFGKFATLLRDNDCELWSVNQGLLTADDDATILTNTIGALTSTREQKEKAVRNISGKIQKAKAGEYPGGYPPYGLDVVCFSDGRESWRVEWVGHYERWKIYPDGSREKFDGKDNFPAKNPADTLRFRPSIDANRLTVVRQIFDWFATENISPGQIATRLNKMGITTTVNTPWNKIIVKQLLRNPVYTGLPAWNKRAGSRFKEYVNGQIQDVTSKVAGRNRKPADYVQPSKPEFEPLIDSDTWERVQSKFVPGKPRSPAQVAELWLKPFLFCGHCDKPMRSCKAGNGMKYGSYFCGTYGTYGKENSTGCRCHRVKHSIIEALVDKYLGEVEPKLTELAEYDDSGLFDMAYDAWAESVWKNNQLWSRMATTVKKKEWPADWWNIDKAYRPTKRPDVEAAIDAKEVELDEMLAGFFKLSPALQDRANKAMEALHTEIDRLRAENEDLSAPWREVQWELGQRQQALQFAASLSDDSGPRRSEALRRVVDKIVCHFRYQGVKSIIDAVEIHPVNGDVLSFTNGVKPGPG